MTGRWAPRQRVVKPMAVVGHSGPHRARRRWRPGAAALWVPAHRVSGGGAGAAAGSGGRDGQ